MLLFLIASTNNPPLYCRLRLFTAVYAILLLAGKAVAILVISESVTKGQQYERVSDIDCNNYAIWG